MPGARAACDAPQDMRRPCTAPLALGLLIVALLPGCSVRSIAVNKIGDAIAETGANFASDDDPELVGDAVPFGLKTMEGLLQSAPRHKGLLLAASSGFVQYAYGWVQLEGDMVEAKDLARATELRERARKLYLRARDYGLRGLEVDFPGLRDALGCDPKAALARTKKAHVPFLYWTAMGWAGAMSLKVNDSDVSADQPIVEALARRALELDPCWGLGSVHEFLISWEAGRSSIGGSVDRARDHFEKDLACAQGRRAFPYLTFGESVSVAKQDKAQFKEMMEKALAIDVSRAGDDQRLANLLAQKRARWQLGRLEELFIE
jgi:predicted anti-sigma-YlaC factor YlaD